MINNKHNYLSKTEMGIGRYTNMAICQIPIKYLFYMRRKRGHVIFDHYAIKSLVEIEIRRSRMNIASSTIKAIEILDFLNEKSVSCTAHDIHENNTSRSRHIASTKRILDSLVRGGLIQGERGTKGGYTLSCLLDVLSVASVNHLFIKPPSYGSLKLSSLHRLQNQLLEQITITQFLTEDLSCYTMIIDRGN